MTEDTKPAAPPPEPTKPAEPPTNPSHVVTSGGDIKPDAPHANPSNVVTRGKPEPANTGDE